MGPASRLSLPLFSKRVACRTLRLLPLLLFTLVAVATAGETPPPGPKDRCLVCGMFVAPYRNWVAVAVLADDRRLYFDGTKDLLRFHFDPARYRILPTAVRQLYVTDYYTVRLMPAREAWFVLGSDVLGPMGPELVPLASREAADAFRRDHGGDILSFGELTADLLSGMQ